MWLIGSSIIKRAFLETRDLDKGSSLGLDVELWWQGYGGLKLATCTSKLVTLLKIREPPKFMLLHVGGNDIGHKPVKELRDTALDLFAFLDRDFPDTILIWSQILPRNWGQDSKKLGKAAKRLNTCIVKQVKQRNGFYIHHTHNLKFNEVNFLSDGVHLTKEGNKMFFANLRFGLEEVLLGRQPQYV